MQVFISVSTVTVRNKMTGQRVRIGIDVGGTFTKAVVIDGETYGIIGKAETLTTHYAPEGVARGVVQVFHEILKDLKVKPESVVFLAHSTTQATNSLLEGDVAPVGIIGMGRGIIEGFLAKRETKLRDIELAKGRVLKTCQRYINVSNINEDLIKQTIKDLVSEGAKVVVATQAFGVDEQTNERFVAKIAEELGLPTTQSAEISKLYGLTVRTRTAVINASILPTMMETANMTENSVRKAEIKAPFMIMRGDGGLMNINEMRKRPILTMLSGPAASVAGALMYLRVSDGIFFEVGGTSTNIGVIRNGKPMVKYAELGGHRTYMDSLDVRVLGVAGGSMVRVKGKEIVDIGPRSAHIAGLPYSAFAKTEEISNPKVVLIQPKQGDPSDYVAIKTSDGKTFAITNTCAANALGITKPGDYAHGNPSAAKKALKALANELGVTVEEAAQRILEISSAKIIRVIETLIEEYELEKDQVVLVGGGGGAAALIPFTAKVLDMDYKISENAEVISSIGVALAMVREVIERMIPNPKPIDILRIKKEAEEAAIKSGAAPQTVEVYIELDPQKNNVRAIALGTTELRTKDLSSSVSMEEAKFIAAKSMRAPSQNVELIATNGTLNVFGTQIMEKKFRFFTVKKQPIRVLDKYGFIKLRKSDGVVLKSTVEGAITDLRHLWDMTRTSYSSGFIPPDIFVIIGGRIVDLSGMINLEQIESIITPELGGLYPDTSVILIGVKGRTT